MTTKKRKIFIAAEIFPPAVGGPATYTAQIANALNKHGFKVRILCYGRPDRSVLNKGIKINYINNFWPTPIKYLFYFFKLYFLLFTFNFPLIYAMGPVSSGWPASWVKKLTGKKLVVKIVGDYAWESAMNSGQIKMLIDEFQNKKFSGKIGKLQKIERQVCQSADSVITPSEYLKKIVKGWKVNSEKISVIYNSFVKEEFKKQAKKHGLVVSIGRLVKWKGFEKLISVSKDLNLDLEIYGEGPEKNKLEKLLNKKIEKLNNLKLLKKLAQAEIFVLNTGYEGLSHVILEAMSVDTAVITTNVGGNPELIKNNENGILIKYNNEQQLKNAILKLHNNPELREKFVTNSKKVLKKFSFKKMIKNTIEILEK